MNIKFRKATDKYFTEKLIRENMEPYYKELRIDWDQGLFEKNWDAFENYTLLVDFKPVGVLRLSHDHLAYYIRDLQVDHRWQSKGIGTKAIEYAVEIARNRRFELLRLRVFRKIRPFCYTSVWVLEFEKLKIKLTIWSEKFLKKALPDVAIPAFLFLEKSRSNLRYGLIPDVAVYAKL